MLEAPSYLIVIAGPTAVGKSDIALRLAQHFDTSILSADARQCFREMSIGTAKPSTEELERVPHYFINSHSIFDEISAGIYEKMGLAILANIFQTHKVAIVCGGTGLYIRALLHGMDEMPSIDPDIEKGILKQYEIFGVDWLKEQLQASDKEYAAQGNMQNPARMLRALTFYKSNQQSILDFQKGNKQARDFEVIGIGLEIPRQALYDRINLRVDKMMEEGLYDEAEALFPHRHLKNLLTVGYQEFYTGNQFPQTAKDLHYAVEKIKQHSRNYAKRQLTWFKNKENFRWFAPQDYESILAYCKGRMQI